MMRTNDDKKRGKLMKIPVIISIFSIQKGLIVLRTVFHTQSKKIHFDQPDEHDDDCKGSQSDEMSCHSLNKNEDGHQNEALHDSPLLALMRMISHSLYT